MNQLIKLLNSSVIFISNPHNPQENSLNPGPQTTNSDPRENEKMKRINSNLIKSDSKVSEDVEIGSGSETGRKGIHGLDSSDDMLNQIRSKKITSTK